jgi:hypothetical protein
VTTPAWIAKLSHELIAFIAMAGLRLTPAQIEALRALLAKSIGAHTKSSGDDDDTNPGFKKPTKH